MSELSESSRKTKIYAVLFPAVPRDFPYRRSIRIFLRGLHIFSAGTLLGGHIFNQPALVLEPWLLATIITGLLILATDLHASMAILFELRGIMIITKISLLLLALSYVEASVPLIFTVLLIGVFGSHIPRQYRHRVFLIGKHITSDERKG